MLIGCKSKKTEVTDACLCSSALEGEGQQQGEGEKRA